MAHYENIKSGSLPEGTWSRDPAIRATEQAVARAKGVGKGYPPTGRISRPTDAMKFSRSDPTNGLRVPHLTFRLSRCASCAAPHTPIEGGGAA